MSHPFELPPDRRDEILRESITLQCPIVVTQKRADGWLVGKSRFLGTATQGNEMIIAHPSVPHQGPSEILGGHQIGISFRRGHKKCVFNTVVLDQFSYPQDSASGTPALLRDCHPRS